MTPRVATTKDGMRDSTYVRALSLDLVLVLHDGGWRKADGARQMANSTDGRRAEDANGSVQHLKKGKEGRLVGQIRLKVVVP